jgi:hypothetical protein
MFLWAMDMTMDVALLFLGTAGFAAYFFVQWLKARQTLERFESANTRFIEALQECAVAGEDPHEAMRAALHELYKDGYGVDVVDLYKAIKSGNVSAAPKRRYRKEQNDYPDAPMM